MLPSVSEPLQGDLLGAEATVHVVAATHPLKTERVIRDLPAGLSLAEIMAEVEPDKGLHRYAFVRVDSLPVHAHYWSTTRPPAGARVTIRAVPQGGGGDKNPLKTLLTIAIIAASFAFPIIAPQTAALVIAGGLTVGQVVGAAIGIVGFLALNAVFPPSQPKLPTLSQDQTRDSQQYLITGGRNRANPWGVVPQVLGELKMVPPLGAKTYTEIVGDDIYYRFLVIWGHGPLELKDFKLGETPIEDFDDVELEHVQGYPDDPALSLFPAVVTEDPLSIELLQVESWQIRRTALNTDEISVDLTFAQGLARFDDAGKKQSRSVQVEIDYIEVGTGNRFNLGVQTFTDKRTVTIRKGRVWKVARGQYDVLIRRVSADNSSSRIVDDVFWTSLRSFRNEDPLPGPGIAATAGRIRGSGQLNGTVDEFSGVPRTICLDWDSGSQTWIERATSNPASLARHVRQGQANKKPVPDSALDLPAFEAWHESNEAAGRRFDAIYDFQQSVWQTFMEVCAAGRAVPVMNGARYSISVDEPRTTIVDHLSPRTILRGTFSGERAFPEVPEGLRVRFVNRDQGYQQDEVLVFRDGFDEATANLYESVDFQGKTSVEENWKEGRRQLAQVIHRGETFSAVEDIRNLLVTRGDLIALTHDVVLAGLASGRIKEVFVDGLGDVTGFRVDEVLTMEGGNDYGMSIRTRDEQISVQLVTEAGDQTVITLVDVIPAPMAPAVGDGFGFGLLGKETIRCLVKGVRPRSNLQAEVILQNEGPAVYTADTGPIPPFTPNVTAGSGLVAPQVESFVSDRSALVQDIDGSWSPRILANVTRPSGLLASVFAVEAQFREQSSDSAFTPLPAQSVDRAVVEMRPVEQGLTYEIQFRYVAQESGGVRRGRWSQVYTHTVIGKSDLPPAPETFTVETMSDGTRRFAWTQAIVPGDVQSGGGYRIRFAAGVETDINAMAPLLDGLLKSSPYETNDLDAGSYTFAITTVDSAGDESIDANFIQAELGTPPLRGILAEFVEQRQNWPGTLIDCFVVNNTLIAESAGTIANLPANIGLLAETIDEVVLSKSVIAYESPVRDLGAGLSFTPRAQVQAEGVFTVKMKTGSPADGDVVGAWVDLAPVTNVQFIQTRTEVQREGIGPTADSTAVTADSTLITADSF